MFHSYPSLKSHAGCKLVKICSGALNLSILSLIVLPLPCRFSLLLLVRLLYFLNLIEKCSILYFLFMSVFLRYRELLYLCDQCFRIFLTLLHSERPKMYTILAFLSATVLKFPRTYSKTEFAFFIWLDTYSFCIVF